VVITQADADATLAAVRLLEAIGTGDDVGLLRDAGRRVRRTREVGLHVRRLARRVAPQVIVHDLGAVSLTIGGSKLTGSSVRRKVLSLLCYLCTRPELTATREQVLEAIWPDLTPELASNSLNQTVYFLRRIFEPDYRDDSSPGYLMSDQDMVWLDRELVHADSQVCAGLLRALAMPGSDGSASALADAYTGRFALDFEYEDWATTYRDHLHARYLEAMERAILRHSQRGDYEAAIYLAHRVLDVDPAADNIERTAIRLYRSMGAFAAAAEQYAHYAQIQRSEFGIEVPPIDTI
jgi:DNA-binding SARP family transcriptional activator